MGCGSSEVSRSVSLQPAGNNQHHRRNHAVQQQSSNQKITMSLSKQVSGQSQPLQPVRQVDMSKYQMTMVGITKRGPTVLSLTSHYHIDILRTRYNFPRYSNAVISLKDLKVGYLIGGVDDLEVNVNQKATIELQILEGQISKKFIQVNIPKLLGDPDNAFLQLPDMNNPRYAHCSIQVDSKLYVIGGRQYGGVDTSILKECEAFDFKTQKWSTIPALSQPRSEACVVKFGDHIYLFGGCTGYDKRTRVIETYSEGDSEWRKLAYQLNEGIESPAIVKSKESQAVIIFGGKSDYGKSNRVYEIDFNKSTILGHVDMEQQRCNHKISQNGDTSYLIGGGTQTIEVYDIKNDHTQINYDINYLQFCSTKQMNSFSQFQSQITLAPKKRKYESPNFKNKVFIFGHSHQPFCKIIDCDKFVVTNDGQSLFHNFYQFTTVVKVNKQHSFILGGINSDFTEVTDVAYSFNLLNEEIKYLEPMKSPRYGMTTIVKGSYLYVLGGRKIGSDDVAILNQCERFSFQSYKWQPIAPLKNKRHSAFAIMAGDKIVVIGGYKGNGARISDIEIYIEQENRWVELDDKFDLAIEAMCPVVFENQIYLFGGRNENNDIQKVFKLKVQVDEGVKYEKSVSMQLQPVGNLSYPGTNLKIYTNSGGLCYIFGNIEGGIDVYDLKKQKVIQREQLIVFERLKDKKFQSYTIVF